MSVDLPMDERARVRNICLLNLEEATAFEKLIAGGVIPNPLPRSANRQLGSGLWKVLTESGLVVVDDAGSQPIAVPDETRFEQTRFTVVRSDDHIKRNARWQEVPVDLQEPRPLGAWFVELSKGLNGDGTNPQPPPPPDPEPPATFMPPPQEPPAPPVPPAEPAPPPPVDDDTEDNVVAMRSRRRRKGAMPDLSGVQDLLEHATADQRQAIRSLRKELAAIKRRLKDEEGMLVDMEEQLGAVREARHILKDLKKR